MIVVLMRVADDRLTAAGRLVATIGMRRGEVLSLRWRDVELNRAAAPIE